MVWGTLHTRHRGTRRATTSVALIATAVVVGACGSGGDPAAGPTAQPNPSTVNLGYLVNLTHAPALIGVSKGFFQGAMPKGTTVKAPHSVLVRRRARRFSAARSTLPSSAPVPRSTPTSRPTATW